MKRIIESTIKEKRVALAVDPPKLSSTNTVAFSLIPIPPMDIGTLVTIWAKGRVTIIIL